MINSKSACELALTHPCEKISHKGQNNISQHAKNLQSPSCTCTHLLLSKLPKIHGIAIGKVRNLKRRENIEVQVESTVEIALTSR